MSRRHFIKSSMGLMGSAAFIGAAGAPFSSPAWATAGARLSRAAPLPVPADGALPVALVIGSGAEVLDVCGPLEVFAGAATANGNSLFEPYTVAATLDPIVIGGKLKIAPDYTFAAAPQPKVVVVPAMDAEAVPQAMCDWIRATSAATDVTMSVCDGAFVLAKTGLLAGKAATAHHGSYFPLAANHPTIRLIRGVRFVEDGNFASSGGISSGIDLALRVVERYVGRDLTEQLADNMEYQGRGWLDPASNAAYAHMPELLGERPRCPVCSMLASRSVQVEYKRRTYYVCSVAHKQMFEAHTDVFERFLAEDAKSRKNRAA